MGFTNNGNGTATFSGTPTNAGTYVLTITAKNAAGTATLANSGNGVFITSSATNNTIGGTAAAARNIISGNSDDGVRISGASSSANVIEGNWIGTDPGGTIALGNAFDGVQVGYGATGNIIGAIAPQAGNTIAYNGGNGVTVRIHTTIDNSIRGNSIFSNAGIGIDLGNVGNRTLGTSQPSRSLDGSNAGMRHRLFAAGRWPDRFLLRAAFAAIASVAAFARRCLVFARVAHHRSKPLSSIAAVMDSAACSASRIASSRLTPSGIC